jgi:YidC/Oxa1 family membrane protein insertase
VTLGQTAGEEKSPYRLRIVLDSKGASVASVDLSDYRETLEEDSPPYRVLSPAATDQDKSTGSYLTERIYLDELRQDVDLRGLNWSLHDQSDEHATFSVTIENGDQPYLEVRKTFTLRQQPYLDIKRVQYDFDIAYELINLTDQDVSAVLTTWGPVGLPREDLRFNDRMLFVGYGAVGAVTVSNMGMSSDAGEVVYRGDQPEDLVWTAVANKYFVAFSVPRALEDHSSVDWLAEVKSILVNENDDEGPTNTFRTVTRSLVIPADQSRQYRFNAYVGPKNRRAFETVDRYERLGFGEQVLSSYSMGPCAFITPKTLTRFMIWLLNSLQKVFINYGLAIIVLVLCVRTALHPVTKRGQVNMMRMQERMGALAPKLEEIKRKYPNDRQKQSAETMKVYQEGDINPMTSMTSSCLPMFLQMPIWISLFTSLNYNIDMRHRPFFLWIKDLTAPDALIQFDGVVHIPLLSSMTGPITSFNLLPIIVSVFMFLQQKLMPKPAVSASQTDEQAKQSAQMQKMMPYMTLVFGLFFYNMPSGLNLYIGASSFFGMIEQMRIRKHIAELKNRPPEENKKKKDPAKKKGPSLLVRMQKAAEEAQKVKKTSGKMHKKK